MDKQPTRITEAVHALKDVTPDAEYELGLTHFLKEHYTPSELLNIYNRFATGEGKLEGLMRRAIWRAIAKRFGHNNQIESGVGFKHLETFEVGEGVFIGAQSYLQGRFDGKFIIGNHAWIGPQSYFDARNLVIGDYVGWGPGAKVLGSMHTGSPTDIPIIQTELEVKPVRIEDWADIGVNVTILPGVTIGKGSIVGANAVVNIDVPPFSVVAGVPAKFIRWRQDEKFSKGSRTADKHTHET